MDRRRSVLCSLRYAVLGRKAANVVRSDEETYIRADVLAQLTEEDIAWVDNLVEEISHLSDLAASLNDDVQFWAVRAARVQRMGRVLGPIFDVCEGGPLEWWRLGSRLRRQEKLSFRAALSLPGDKLRGLKKTMHTLKLTLGRLSRCTEEVFSACTREDGLARFHISKGRTEELLAAVRALPSLQRTDGTGPALSESGSLSTLRLLHSTMLATTRPYRARPAWQRNWVRFVGTGVVLAAGAQYVRANFGTLQDFLRTTARHVLSFMSEHVYVPVSEITKEVFGGDRLKVADAAALDDARATLSTMLTDYFRRLSKRGAWNIEHGTDFAALAQKGDMRPVSAMFAAESSRPIIGFAVGDLLEVMLIQIAHLKVEVMSALAATDAVLAENRINFAVAASIPAIGLAYVIGQAVSFLYRSATAPADNTDWVQRIEVCLHDLLLELDKSESISDGDAARLDDETQGSIIVLSRKLALSLHALRAFISEAEFLRMTSNISSVMLSSRAVTQKASAARRLERFRFFENRKLYPSITYE